MELSSSSSPSSVQMDRSLATSPTSPPIRAPTISRFNPTANPSGFPSISSSPSRSSEPSVKPTRRAPSVVVSATVTLILLEMEQDFSDSKLRVSWENFMNDYFRDFWNVEWRLTPVQIRQVSTVFIRQRYLPLNDDMIYAPLQIWYFQTLEYGPTKLLPKLSKGDDLFVLPIKYDIVKYTRLLGQLTKNTVPIFVQSVDVDYNSSFRPSARPSRRPSPSPAVVNNNRNDKSISIAIIVLAVSSAVAFIYILYLVRKNKLLTMANVTDLQQSSIHSSNGHTLHEIDHNTIPMHDSDINSPQPIYAENRYDNNSLPTEQETLPLTLVSNSTGQESLLGPPLLIRQLQPMQPASAATTIATPTPQRAPSPLLLPFTPITTHDDMDNLQQPIPTAATSTATVTTASNNNNNNNNTTVVAESNPTADEEVSISSSYAGSFGDNNNMTHFRQQSSSRGSPYDPAFRAFELSGFVMQVQDLDDM